MNEDPAPEQARAERASRRLAAWRAALSPSADPVRLAQRLRHLGWSEDDALERLGPERAEIFEQTPDPVADALLECGLVRLESTAPRPLDPAIPFGETFGPLAEVALAEPSDALRRALGETAAPALLPELRRAGGYENFVAALRAGGLRALLARHPVLARDLARQMRQAREAAAEFLTRLENDRTELAALFPGASGAVVKIDPELGDAHRGGRRVMGVTFAGGRRLIYKPRGLRMDVAWHRLIAWLRARDSLCRLRAPLALDRGDYGWVEGVEPGAPDDPAEYYRRAGELLALAWLCGGSDFHEENVIASTEGPVLIDLETLFTPVPRPFGATDEELAAAGDELASGSSVLTTLLLPVWQIDEGGHARDLSGFTGSHREGADWHEPRWVDLGTDRLREEMRPAPGRQPHNVPRDASGLLVSATPFTGEITAGFIATARGLLAARDDLPLEGFRGAEIRFLVRNTQVYGVMRQRLRRPEFRWSGADRSIELEKLARAFLPPDPDAPCPEVFRCYEAERRGLENGDVPIFRARNDETTLRGDGGVEIRGYFWKTGWQMARGKLRRLDDPIIAEQAALVRSSLQLRYAADRPAAPADWVGAATAIADDLAARAIPLASGGVSWLSLGFDPVRKMQNAGPAGLDLYSGTLGVAIFLAALARATGDERWETLARACTRPRLDRMREERARPVLAHLPLGLGAGLGSFVYGCQLLGELLGDSQYFEDAHRFANVVGERDSAPEAVNDVLGGETGAILALLNLHAAAPDDALLAAAARLGRNALARRTPAASGHRGWQPDFARQPLTGLGHGAAGFAWALGRLGAATGDADFLAASAEAIAYERSTYDAEAGNWPDFRRGAERSGERAFMCGWCAGAPGIGLARLAQFGAANAEAQAEIDVALRDAREGAALRASHLCCGESARLELLLEGARVRADDTLRRVAEARAARLLAARNETGVFPLTGADQGRLFAPSFFQGTSGIGYTLLRLADPALPSVAVFRGGA